MTLQGNLRIEYNAQSFDLNVKTILLKGVYYFFITENEKVSQLLSGETLELVFADGFIAGDKKSNTGSPAIPEEILAAIKNMLIDNKELWYY